MNLGIYNLYVDAFVLEKNAIFIMVHIEEEII